MSDSPHFKNQANEKGKGKFLFWYCRWTVVVVFLVDSCRKAWLAFLTYISFLFWLLRCWEAKLKDQFCYSFFRLFVSFQRPYPGRFYLTCDQPGVENGRLSERVSGSDAAQGRDGRRRSGRVGTFCRRLARDVIVFLNVVESRSARWWRDDSVRYFCWAWIVFGMFRNVWIMVSAVTSWGVNGTWVLFVDTVGARMSGGRFPTTAKSVDQIGDTARSHNTLQLRRKWNTG